MKFAIRAFVAIISYFMPEVLASSAHTFRRIQSIKSIEAADTHYIPQAGEKRAVSKEEFPVFPKPYTIDEERRCTGYWEVGCMMDKQTGARFYYTDHVPKEDRQPMTHEVCWNFCKNVTGVQAFGLLEGRECFCTPFFHYSQGGGGIGQCTEVCEGNAAQYCGGMSKALIFQMHDCNNLPATPCNRPAAMIAHAKPFPSRAYLGRAQPCKNMVQNKGNTVEHSMCDIECEPGYYQLSNDLHCEEKGDRLVFTWAQFTGRAVCAPVSCGALDPIVHERCEMQEVFFEAPGYAMCTCQTGYSLDGLADGPTSYRINCTAEGKFTDTKECLPVKCGEEPKHPNTMYMSMSGMKTFGDIIKYKCEIGYTLDSTAEGPKNFQQICTGSGEFTEPMNCTPVVCGPAPEFVHSKRKCGENKCSDDEFVQYPQQLEYHCDKGYSQNKKKVDVNKKSENDIFLSECQADGMFSVPEDPCTPVVCGFPPPVENSVVENRELVYEDKVWYFCNEGHTVDSSAEGDKMFPLECGADGKFVEAPKFCKPVDCGTPPSLEKAGFENAADEGSSFTYQMLVGYVCAPGYSLDKNDNPYEPTSNDFAIACTATGKYEDPPPCVNINDCKVHDCGNFGKCVDVEEPTDIPDDNYNCDCNSGYEEIMQPNGQKNCTNINDCPLKDSFAHNCGGHGECVDLVNTYTCKCETGYELTDLKEPTGNATCTPSVCGEPPKSEHATFEVTHDKLVAEIISKTTTKADDKQAVFKESVEYTCDEGFSLDAKASGKKSFEIDCKTGRVFTARMDCLAVSCGPPYSIDNGYLVDESLREMFYSKKESERTAEYECFEGYSTDGTIDGDIGFSVTCEPNGRKSEPKECKPVECGVPEKIEHGKVGDEKKVYPEKVQYTCDEGYSTDGTTNVKKRSFEVSCTSEGVFSEGMECVPVECGEAPDVKYATNDGTEMTVYPQVVKYKTEEGYTLDCKADGPTEFETKCQADGTFSKTSDVLPVCPVNCGIPPKEDHATRPKDEKSFKEEVTYTCDLGYSTDGAAAPDGAENRAFTAECLATGKYSERKTCEAVECPKVPTPDHAERQGSGKVVFPKSAKFKCNPGWATDGVVGGEQKFSVECLATGDFGESETCKNMNDCADNMCGPHGKCIDKEEPTGVHIDDYTCDCDSGFELKKTSVGGKEYWVCENVPDCPPDACLPGACEDLVNDYKCNCPEGGGYYEGPNKEEDLKHDCLPQKCGPAPDEDHATHESSGDLFFMDTVEYTCDEGYTLDAAPDGEKQFVVTCEAGMMGAKTGKLSEAPECKPVACGVAPEANFADWQKDKSLAFPEQMEFDCKEGYTTTGKCEGPSSFKMECTAEGSIVFVDPKKTECLPILVGTPTEEQLPNAAFVNAEMYFPEKQTVTCLEGYSTNKDSLEAKDREFELKTLANCEFDEHPECVPIQCKPEPEIEHTSKEGGVVFGEALKFTCDKGFSLDGTTQGLKTFELKCLSSGEFEPEQECQPVSCGVPAEIPHGKIKSGSALLQVDPKHATHTQMKLSKSTAATPSPNKKPTNTTAPHSLADGGHKSHKVTHQLQDRKKRHWHKRREPAVFGDKVEYECDEGYTLDGKSDGERTFTTECMEDGSIKGMKTCKPVSCGVAEPKKNSMPAEEEEKFFTDKIRYLCNEGYSIDGKVPKGPEDAQFSEECQADGSFTEEGGCKDIDWCELSECGENGECKDVEGDLFYTCDCNDGYQSAFLDSGLETCEEINECDAWSGDALCTSHGKCKDGLMKFTCECDPGYEVEEISDSRQTCVPKVCGEVPEIEHAASVPKMGKIKFPDSVSYTCMSGYSTTGEFGGDTNFVVSCEDTGDFSEKKECKPVQCPEMPEVENAKVDAGAMKYPEKKNYTCDEGHTTNGLAAGPTKFSVRCTEEGMLTDTEKCKPITCGMLPMVIKADFEEKELFFDEEEVYHCQEGFTTDGTAEGEKKFTVKCTAKGEYEGVEACNRVKCGVPPIFENGLHDLNPKYYGEFVTITCDAGYTTTHRVQDPSGFTITCEADGEYSRKTLDAPESVAGKEEACRPVSCGIPKDTAHASPKDVNEEIFYMKSAEWECHEKFSVNGLPTGKKEFSRVCEASGDFGDASPSDCKDIDFCHKNPCGKNGMCVDCTTDPEGCEGPLEPPEEEGGEDTVEFLRIHKKQKKGGRFGSNGDYSCHCDEGYETKEDPELTCSEDDCAGHTCGDGGTCIDLSKEGKEGQYTCECEDGYELDESGEEITCRRVSCGVLPKVEKSDFEYLPFKERSYNPELPIEAFASDEILYTCHEGYSTDGSHSEEAMTFTASCTTMGLIMGIQQCRRVKCDNIQLPLVPNTAPMSRADKESFFEYEDKVTFTCAEGFTLDAKPQGEKTFEIECLADGTFTEPDVCKPVKCGKGPRVEHASMSTNTAVEFGDAITYSCMPGYTSEEGKSFSIECQADGTLTDVSQCKPISCGEPPLVPNGYILDASNCGAGGEEEMMGEEEEYYYEDLLQVTPHAHRSPKTLHALVHHRKSKGMHKHKTHQSHGRTQKQKQLYKQGHANQLNHTQPEGGDEGGDFNMCSPTELVFGEWARYSCKPGYTLSGKPGDDSDFTVQCGAKGDFTGLKQCVLAAYKVQGKVSDASKANSKVKGATVKFTHVSTGKEVSGITNKWGVFTIDVPMGDHKMVASKAGYITRGKDVEVFSKISVGTSADIALSKTMKPDQWRIVLNWGETSRDLDSWMYFGKNLRCRDSDYKCTASCKSGWTRLKSGYCSNMGGVQSRLERDDVSGFGPETTYLTNVGKCKKSSKVSCLMVFVVHNYTPKSADLKDSTGSVTLFNGNKQVMTIEIPPNFDPKKRYFPVFALDAGAAPYGEVWGYPKSEGEIDDFLNKLNEA